MTVRPQRDSDIGAVAAVHVRTWRAAYPDILPAEVLADLDPVEVARRRRGFAGPAGLTNLVAVDGDVVTGFVTFGPYRRQQSAGHLEPGVGEVWAIYVDPAHWRTGTGRALLGAALAAADERGWREVRLWVAEANQRARQFYERLGLVADGDRSMYQVRRPAGRPAVRVPELRYAIAVSPRRSAPTGSVR